MSDGRAPRRDAGSGGDAVVAGSATSRLFRTPLTLPPARDSEPACAMCAGPWRELGHCKGVCLRCGFMQSCVDTL